MYLWKDNEKKLWNYTKNRQCFNFDFFTLKIFDPMKITVNVEKKLHNRYCSF
jgi:hypothetical protein